MSIVHFHDSIGLSPRQLVAANVAAKGQDAFILDLFRATGRPMTPSAVWAACSEAGKRWPITSCRRAITNLTKAGALVKLDRMMPGPFGLPEHCWALPQGQGELFGRAAA